MGYQAESGPWRDFYLTGAMEAREPRPVPVAPRQGANAQLFSLGGEDLLESLSVRLDGERAGAIELALTLRFSDTGETFEITVGNGVLRHRATTAKADVALSRQSLVQLVLGQTDLETAGLACAGLTQLLALLDRFDFWFNIVTP